MFPLRYLGIAFLIRKAEIQVEQPVDEITGEHHRFSG